MARQRFCVAHIYHSLEQLEGVEALPPALVTALYPKSQQRTKIIAKVAVRHWIKRIVGETHIVHPLDQRMSTEKLRDPTGILDVPLDAESHGLDSLQKQESVERRQRRSSISLAHRATTRDKGCVSELIHII